jgi:large subunit ribosomal protein L24
MASSNKSVNIKKGDQVRVIAGNDKGVEGKVIEVITETDRVIVEGVNRVKRHQKPTQKMPQGGITEKELPIHASNVMPIDTKTNKPTRVRSGKDKDGNKIRVAKSGATIGS